jgi:diadenylate cyclase
MDTLISFLGTIRWQDIADITINSYILFRLYIIFRGTNAFRVLIGLVFLWFFQRLAVSLGLIITSWAIQAITAVAALIIIVVFRNEIRSVLQTKNLKAILWEFPHNKVLTSIEIIVESVFKMAENRIGALVIFPGNEDLKELVQAGIAWDGRVSEEMIMSIFWHDNPVHDGAAIIKGDRIAEVGVILPLSHRKDLPTDYGTRHRAALGLTESSDALAVVVSEEKGAILFAKNAKMTVTGQKEKLRQILREHTGVISTPQEFYKSEKFRIAAAAAASVLFMICIWFSFFRGMETLTTIQTPIDYLNRDAKVEILETSVNDVDLTLSGSGPLIKSIRPDQVMVRIDLSNAVVGKNTFTLTKENITLPPAIILKSVNPQRVEVLLDFPMKKELPVQVDWVGKLSKDLILISTTTDPEATDVIGRNLVLKETATIYTEKVLLGKIRKSGSITVNLALSPASLKFSPDAKDKVTVNFVVKERTQ